MPRPTKAFRRQKINAATAWKRGDKEEAYKLWAAAAAALKEHHAKKREKHSSSAAATTTSTPAVGPT